jgi:YVTN family beta-propeller protein
MNSVSKRSKLYRNILNCCNCFRGTHLVILLTLLAATALAKPKKAEEPTTSSGPIAISPDDSSVWVVNPDNNSVSVFDVAGDANNRIAEISVGEEPRFVTIGQDGKTVYVSNSRSGTVSEIDADSLEVVREIEVGTEPAGLAVTPDGKRLFVANFSSGDVAMINVHSGHVQKPHRSAGTAGVDTLADSNARKAVVRLLLSIDSDTPTFP